MIVINAYNFEVSNAFGDKLFQRVTPRDEHTNPVLITETHHRPFHLIVYLYFDLVANWVWHCAKSQIFGPEFARIRIGSRRVCRNVLTYSITADSKYTLNILEESGLFFRIQI